MQLSDFDFLLPPDAIAQYPTPERCGSRLLAINPLDGHLTHHSFSVISEFIQPGDLLVLNDTRVIPARLFGRKRTGGQVEVLVERILDAQTVLVQMRVSKTPRPGDELYFAQGIRLRILERQGLFFLLRYHPTDPASPQNIQAMLDFIGQVPLPPYMHRAATSEDKERYQTVYAVHPGSVAAPTAGLHFDHPLLDRLQKQGVQLGYLTLHVGAGTFAPIRTEIFTEHKMHIEYFHISETLAAQIENTQHAGKRVIAVGTTTLRALESASQYGPVQAGAGQTDLFIYPGYCFHCVDALITNFHLPCSTLLMLVTAFGGYETVMNAYRTAVKQGYRFYSYGDAMWVTKN